MHKILCFDTANNSCSVSVAEGKNVLFFEEDFHPTMQSKRLILMIENALKSTNMKYYDINYLAVTIGPGSFSGIKIGLAAAKAILFATKIKPVAIDYFELAYYRALQQIKNHDRVFVILNAYRNQSYMQEFLSNGSKEKPFLVDDSNIQSLLESAGGKIVCTGSGVAKIYHDIQNIKNINILPRFSKIRANQIVKLADQKITNNQLFDQLHPLYIRAPDAIIPNSCTRA